MSIGYAQINSISSDIDGLVIASAQEGIFIYDVQLVSESTENADILNSKINYSYETILNTDVSLVNDINSHLTYRVYIKNNTDDEQLFIGAITDFEDIDTYSNKDIIYTVNGLEEKETVLKQNESIDFTITFSYRGDLEEINNTKLSSKINFRFKEVPKLLLSSENEIYELNNIYPNYTPQEYTFTISNNEGPTINKAPMSYSFDIKIDAPLSAKIFDQDGNEITENINIAGDGQTIEQHTYTLKIIWDNTNPETGKDFNNEEYANKEFICLVTVSAFPTDEKYLGYNFNKQFRLDIKTATFDFNLDKDSYNVNIEKTSSNMNILVSNNSGANYNIYDTEYELSIVDNNKFTPSISGSNITNNVFKRIISGGGSKTDNFTINLAADINTLSTTENATLKINVVSPYKKTISVPITLKLQPVTVTLNKKDYAGTTSTITVYKGKTYSNLPTPTWTGHTFNGWYTSESGGSQVTTSTEVTTTSATQTLYARWTSNLLADNVKVGDYISYPVKYDNVPTNSSGAYTPSTNSAYKGWRVLSIEGTGDNKYVRIVTAGIGLTYVHPASSSSGTTSVNNLTTKFFSTAINSTSTSFTFRRCGFYTSSTSTTKVTTIAQLKTAFTNDYTQISSSTPQVQSMTKEDVDKVWGSTTENGEYLTTNNLLAIPTSTSGEYAAYHLATSTLYNGNYYLWNVRYGGAIIFTNNEHGIRPVVKLNTNVIKTGGSGTTSSPYTIGLG